MPKDILSQIIENKQLLVLLGAFVIYVLNWCLIIKLGLIINRIIVKNRIIFPWAFFGAVYSLFAKLIVSDLLYFFTSLTLLWLILKKISRLSLLKTFFPTVLSLLSAFLGLLLFGQPLLVNCDFKMIFSQPEGIILGSLIELILPLSIYIILRYNLHHQAIKNKNHSIGISIYIYMVVLFLVYCVFALLFYLLAHQYDPILWQVIISEIILISVSGFILFRVQAIIKKEQQQSEENHSTYLLRTILSKQREYCNFFQVIRTMAEGGKTRAIIDYIDDLLVEMSSVDIDEENPIFTALQVAEQIKAKEKGIIITTTTKSTLSQLKEPVKVYDIFKDLLQYFVAYEEGINSENHHIHIEVTEDEQHYSFMIIRKTAEEESPDPRAECNPLGNEQTLQQIKKRIQQLHGKLYFLYRGSELVGCVFKVGKNKLKQFPFSIVF